MMARKCRLTGNFARIYSSEMSVSGWPRATLQKILNLGSESSVINRGDEYFMRQLLG